MSRLPFDFEDSAVRDEVMAAMKPTDAFGRSLPKRMGATPFVELAIRSGVPTRMVPEEYWAPATDLENHLQAVISCPCGQTVIVELAWDLAPCPGCERWFYFSGEVFVLNTPSPAD